MLLSIFLTGCGRPLDKPADGSTLRFEARELGSASAAILKAEPYSKLQVEIVSVEGRELLASTKDFIASFLAAHTNKPGGITVVMDQPLVPTGTGGLSVDDLKRIEDSTRRQFASGDTATLFIMFLDNHSSDDAGDAKVLGLAYRSTSIAIFKNTILTETDPPQRSLIEKTVVAHELGHLFGLVGLGAPSKGNHLDVQHGAGHCTHPNCLMNYAVNTSRLLFLFGNNHVPGFDEECMADLEAAGGR